MSLLLKPLDPELQRISQIRPPVRVKDFLDKRYHRSRLLELSLKSIGKAPQLDELTYEQEVWVDRRMKGSARSWEVWDA